jgi:hypothetical protein
MVVLLTTVKLPCAIAEAPIKTLVAPERLVPVIVRVAPFVKIAPTLAPVTAVTVGFWITVTEAELVEEPPALATVTVPVTKPVGTVKLIEVAPLVKPVTALVPNLTELTAP